MLSLIHCALLASAPTLEVPATLELTQPDPGESAIATPRKAIKMGLTWLARHQSPSGYWNHKEFWKDNMAGGTQCVQGAGAHVQHVGCTGLALLALVGDERSLKQGEYAAGILSAVEWLLKTQDPESGRFGEILDHTFHYDHAITTLALADTLTLCAGKKHFEDLPDTRILSALTKAEEYIRKARNPNGVWRYDNPPSGDNDTSVTGWMLAALNAAGRHTQSNMDAAHKGTLDWIEQMTDPDTARIGYSTRGSCSARVTKVNDDFPTDQGETLTAIGLHCRFLLGQARRNVPIIKRHAELILKAQPTWNPETIDMYYWYHATLAMSHMDSKSWRSWKKPMEKVALETQCEEKNDYQGSWDPLGAWGWSGGRIYSTALMLLILEEIAG